MECLYWVHVRLEVVNVVVDCFTVGALEAKDMR